MKSPVARGGAVLVALVFLALAFRLFRLTAEYAVNIFFWDQWDFNDATVFSPHSLWQIFRFQHGPHRQGLGGLLAALVDPIFRWNTRSEAFVATALVVVAGLFMLYLKCRLLGPLTWTDVAIPMLVFTPAQWEPVWTTVNFAHGTLPVLLIVLYCLTWTWTDERARYALMTALNFGILYTGLGLIVGLLTPVLLLAQYRGGKSPGMKKYLLTCTALSIASLASFFVSYKNQDASGCTSIFSSAPLEYGRFFFLLFATPFGIRGTGWMATLAGGLVLLAVAAIAAVSWKTVLSRAEVRALPIVQATLSAYMLIFCAAAAIGRTCTSLQDAHTSRYGNYRQLLVLCLFFGALALPRPRWRAVAPLLVLLLIPSLFLTQADAGEMIEDYQLKSGWRDCYLGGKSIAECDDTEGLIYPDPQLTHLQQKLDYLRAKRLNLFDHAPEVRR
ncbi:MAG TPA: hypothetical protein VHW09_22220 [Bryobacteraceae bacterium]|jgi:hypothetical protein|nr:hypothetical protein [Bryobacteraceae bacterium]